MQRQEQLHAVAAALRAIRPRGQDFALGEFAMFPSPWLTVEGFDFVPLTLAPEDIPELLTHAHSRFDIPCSSGNTAWTDFVDGIVDECRTHLGIAAETRTTLSPPRLILSQEGDERHALPTKHTTSIATLVFAQPRQNCGWQLQVDHPNAWTGAKPLVTWDLTDASPFVLRYTAFYNQCERRWRRVGPGPLLTLVYELLVDEELVPDAMPRVGLGAKSYETLKNALADFFSDDTTKYQRLDNGQRNQQHRFIIGDPATHRAARLVYPLSEGYSQPHLSFKHLARKDAIVAASLLTFCEESHGAFCLILCRLACARNQVPSENTFKHFRLKLPWVVHGVEASEALARLTDIDDSTEYVAIDPEQERIPMEIADRPGVDFQAVLTSLYDVDPDLLRTMHGVQFTERAALVLAPLAERYKLEFALEPTMALRSWLALTREKPREAKLAAASFAGVASQSWQLTHGDRQDGY